MAHQVVVTVTDAGELNVQSLLDPRAALSVLHAAVDILLLQVLRAESAARIVPANGILPPPRN